MRITATKTSILFLSLLTGCALFRSPDDRAPRSRYDVDSADGKTAQSAPLLDPDKFSSTNIRRSWKAAIGRGPNKEFAKQNYELGRAAYDEASKLEGQARVNKFREAAEYFTTAADRWPDTSLEQDALFMSGECYFFAEYYVDANRKYELLIKRYPNTRHMDVVESRRFQLAKYWLLANDKDPYAFYQFNMFDESRPWYDHRGNALRLYDKIRVDDPTGKLSDDATMAAANERFLKREYERADDYYTDLVKAYPESEHQFNAHFFGLKAKLLSYRGSAYAGESLDEGEKLIKQMRRQFPREAAEQREFLDRAFAEIRYKKAERRWNMAEYYDRRGEYGGARYYYDIVSREFDDTPFGERATARNSQIADKPAKPPQRLQWVVDLFPESDELKPILAKALVQPGEEAAGQSSPVNGNGEIQQASAVSP